jgi:transposase
MRSRELPDDRWWAVASIVSKLTSRGPKGDLRTFIEAVIWILRSGAPWRDLAQRFGCWERIYRRFRRWALSGRWEALRKECGLRIGSERLLIDSTIVKAHSHAAGALKRTGGQKMEALGRSRGGFTTKLHALVTESGQLVRYVATGGQVNDITQARELVRGGEGVAVIGDRAYDSDPFLEHVAKLGMCAVVPSRSHRKQPRALDIVSYRARQVIERWFGRMKAFRRVATRYDKTASSYVAFVAMAAWLVALSGWPR